MKDFIDRVLDPKILTAAGGLILAGFSIYLLMGQVMININSHDLATIRALEGFTSALRDNTEVMRGVKDQLYWQRNGTSATPPPLVNNKRTP